MGIPWLAITGGAVGALFWMSRAKNYWGKKGLAWPLIFAVILVGAFGWYLDTNVVSYTEIIIWGMRSDNIALKMGMGSLVLGTIVGTLGVALSVHKTGQLTS